MSAEVIKSIFTRDWSQNFFQDNKKMGEPVEGAPVLPRLRSGVAQLYNDLAAIVILLQPSSKDFFRMLDAASSAVKACSINIVAAYVHIIVQHIVILCFIFKRGSCCAKTDIGYLCGKTFDIDILYILLLSSGKHGEQSHNHRYCYCSAGGCEYRGYKHWGITVLHLQMRRRKWRP